MEGTHLGSYHLHEELGSGGMGTVYRATVTDRAPGSEQGEMVAVKILHSHLLSKPGFFKRFLREAEVGMRVDHPNVVRTLDVDATEIDGRTIHYIVVEYVEGRSLRERLDWDGILSDSDCRAIAQDVASGLKAIHAAGVVHRDLKPENILVTEGGTMKIMDLGIAHLKDEAIRLSQTGQFVGTILYAAPEQFEDSRVTLDGRADLYALGLTMFELRTGYHPFASKDVHVAIRKQLIEDAPRVREAQPRASEFIDQLVNSLLAKNPNERIPTAETLLRILEDGVVPAELQARRHPRAGVGGRRVPKRGLLLAAGLLLLAVLLGFSLMTNSKEAEPEPAEKIAKAGPAEADPPPDTPENQTPEKLPELPEKAPEEETTPIVAPPPSEPEAATNLRSARDGESLVAAHLEQLASKTSDASTAVAFLSSAKELYASIGDAEGTHRVERTRAAIVARETGPAAARAAASLSSTDEEKALALIDLSRKESEFGSLDKDSEEALLPLMKGTGFLRLALVRATGGEDGLTLQARPRPILSIEPKPWGLRGETVWLTQLRWPPGTYEVTLRDPETRKVLRSQEVQIDAGKTVEMRVPLQSPAGMAIIEGPGRRPFFMDLNEVTVGQYRQFQPDRPFSHQQADFPAHGLKWVDARRYASWIGKQLPTVEQWLYAAFGDTPRRFPWGDDAELSRHCNVGTRAPRPVGSFPLGRSPFGLNDMAGNVWEWLRDGWALGGGYNRSYLITPRAPHGWDKPVNFLLDPRPSEKVYHTFRDPVQRRNYDLYRVKDSMLDEYGFRCVLEIF